MYLCNPCSLNNKIDEFEAVITTNNADVAVIIESWFLENQLSDQWELPGYTLLYKNRVNRRGGGVALYACKHLNARPLHGIGIPDDLDLVWMQIE